MLPRHSFSTGPLIATRAWPPPSHHTPSPTPSPSSSPSTSPTTSSLSPPSTPWLVRRAGAGVVLPARPTNASSPSRAIRRPQPPPKTAQLPRRPELKMAAGPAACGERYVHPGPRPLGRTSSLDRSHQKCDEGSANHKGMCNNCARLEIECLGWGAKRPDWMRVSRATCCIGRI